MYNGLPKHKGPSHTSIKEKTAVRTLRNLLDLNRILDDIKEDDKFPNMDGTLQILDDNGIPLGNLIVQVKYREWDITNPKAKKIDLSIFNYTTITNDPVLFIGADDSKAYWIYISKELFHKNNFKKNQKEATINLELDNVLDGNIDSTNKYLYRWIDICRMHQYKFNSFDELKRLNKQLSKRYEPLLGVTKPEFHDIHIFLDKVNELLGNLPIIKDRFYPNAWKIGFACFSYDIKDLMYTLYSIPFEKNDIQIKKINNEEINELSKEYSNLIKIFPNSNPIKENPEKQAINDAKNFLNQILSEKLLYNHNIFLANEFIFAFIKKYHKLLGLELKETYQIEEIKKPLTDMNNGAFKDFVGATHLLFYNFADLLLFLEVKNIKTVKNTYLNTYEMFKDESGRWPEPIYDNVKNNWKLIIENCAEVYNDLIKINFPNIKDKLPIFNGSTGIVFILSPIDEIKYMTKWQTTYSIIGYKKEGNKNFKASFYLFEDENKPKIDMRENTIKVDGITCKISYNYYSGFNIMDLEKTPMLNFVYRIIGESTKEYFKNIDQKNNNYS